MQAIHCQRAVGDDYILTVVVGVVETDDGVGSEGNRAGGEAAQQGCRDCENKAEKRWRLFHRLSMVGRDCSLDSDHKQILEAPVSGWDHLAN
jgi:hypothetical protein